MTNILKADSKNIRKAARLIKKGLTVAFPTETVYGLGADAFNPEAVVRIFRIKNRPEFFPLIVHISEPGQARRLFRSVSREAEMLMERFWPGPLTIVLEKADRVPDIVTSGNPTVGVRMPDHPVALELIRQSGTPLAAPSANRSGSLSPTSAEEVYEELGEEAGLILDGGRTGAGIESTVLSLAEKPVILRSGRITQEAIEEVIGKVMQGPGSPARIKTRTPFVFLAPDTLGSSHERDGLLAFKPWPDYGSFRAVEVLSRRGDPEEAAGNLFPMIGKLDRMGLEKIYVEKIPETGLGQAMMQRLKRLAAGV